uniref:Ig-like domain-containing protein n=1 Tax=Oncorhynchus kisutch TaxID=8019 RepID=A0A8C7MXW3_ONCKI
MMLFMFVFVCILAAVQSLAMRLVSANKGDTVTLHCFHEGNLTLHFLWFKQSLGVYPQLMTTFYKYDNNATFYNAFKGNPCFSVQSGKGIKQLWISDMQLSDSVIYHCGRTILIVKGTKSDFREKISKIYFSETLNCTIHTETCAGEHSVFWFRHGSGESPPGIIYAHGDRSDQCEKSPEAGSPTQSCVYNLPKRNLILSDARTYYCAVVSCGEILFGNGTKLYIAFDDYYPQMKIQVLLSIIGTGVVLCCLTIFIIIYLIRK